jgi:hypothetical protein
MPSKIEFSDWFGLTLNRDLDRKFHNSLTELFKGQTAEEAT